MLPQSFNLQSQRWRQHKRLQPLLLFCKEEGGWARECKECVVDKLYRLTSHCWWVYDGTLPGAASLKLPHCYLSLSFKGRGQEPWPHFLLGLLTSIPLSVRMCTGPGDSAHLAAVISRKITTCAGGCAPHIHNAPHEQKPLCHTTSCVKTIILSSCETSSVIGR